MLPAARSLIKRVRRADEPRGLVAEAYNRRMEHFSSEWHRFNPKSAHTYPKIDAPLQVRYANGAERKGSFKELFSPRKTSLDTQIAGWRYIKDPGIG
jgi:hypothetical protein